MKRLLIASMLLFSLTASAYMDCTCPECKHKKVREVPACPECGDDLDYWECPNGHGSDQERAKPDLDHF